MTARAWLESEAWQVMADFGPPKAPELKKGSHLESILGHQGCQSWKGLKVSRINLGYQFLKSWKMRDPQFCHVILWIWWLCLSHHLVLFDFSNTGCISLAFLHCEPLMADGWVWVTADWWVWAVDYCWHWLQYAAKISIIVSLECSVIVRVIDCESCHGLVAVCAVTILSAADLVQVLTSAASAD